MSRKAWRIEPVVLADARAIARNNMAAYWEDKHWRLQWKPDITLEFLIDQVAQRVPGDLIYRRDILRHLKAVDPDSGALAGYLRLALPEELARTANGEVFWPEAQVADVSAEERKHLEAMAEQAWYQPNDHGADDRAMAMQREVLSRGTYLKLRYVAVHPQYQGRGVAQALIAAVIDKSQELGVDMYLMGSEAGYPVYVKLGFQEVEKVVEDMIHYGGEGHKTTTFMIRSAGTHHHS